MVEVVVEKKAKMSAQQSIVWLVVCTHEPHVKNFVLRPLSFPFLTPNDHQLLGMLLSNQTLAAGDAKR